MRKKQKVLQQVLVEDYASEGKAISRHEGKVIFIEGAVPGDLVDVRITKSKADWAEGKAISFHKFSEERVKPFCEHFGVCGGCKWQMLPYHKQIAYKQNEVAQHLKRIGKVKILEIAPILGAFPDRRYRNKLEFTFSNRRYLLPSEIANRDEIPAENALGFHVAGIFDKVIDINTCHLMEEPTNAIRNLVRSFAEKEGYSYYDIRNHVGFLRNLMVRICRTGEVMINLVTGYEDEKQSRKLIEHLVSEVPVISSAFVTLNPKHNDSIYDLSPELYYGQPYVIETLENFRFKIGPKSFFQTNTFQGERLYSITRDFAELTGRETVYDLYCGTGSIGIFLSGKAASIIGVETINEAVEDARENAALNGISHAKFFSGDVIDVCDQAFFDTHGRPDTIITDPPRAGMHQKLVEKILETEAPTVVYVSCNTATQARDLNLLDEKYVITQIQPVDMFPHTHHIENVVQLKLRRGV